MANANVPVDRTETSAEIARVRFRLSTIKSQRLPHVFKDGPRGNEAACRVVFVHSSADQKVTSKQRQKQLARIETDLKKCQTHVQRRGAYSAPAAVSRRMAKLLSKSTVAKHITWSMEDLTEQQQENQVVEGSRQSQADSRVFGIQSTMKRSNRAKLTMGILRS